LIARASMYGRNAEGPPTSAGNRVMYGSHTQLFVGV
jgi:hypothetical protein